MTQNELYALGLHFTPDNEGVLNVIKRCRHITDVEWTPVFDLPKITRMNGFPSSSRSYEDVFHAGETYRGIPYSFNGAALTNGHGHSSLAVGIGTGIETFLTSIRARGTVQQMESRFKNDFVPGMAAYYGSFCSGLFSYAFDFGYCFLSQIRLIDGVESIGKLIDEDSHLDLSLIRPGDFLLNRYHVAIITDLIRNPAGRVSYIEVSETTTSGVADNNSGKDHKLGGISRRKFWTPESFFLQFGTYELLRYRYIADVPYEPCAYVPVGDEPHLNPDPDLPVVPYMGNKFIFKKGYTEKNRLIISSEGFRKLKVEKDGQPFREYDIAGIRAVDVDFTEAGTYEAYLADLEQSPGWHSVPCTFRVSSLEAETEKEGADLHVTLHMPDVFDVPAEVTFGAYSNVYRKIRKDQLSRTLHGDGSVTFRFTVTLPDWAEGKLFVLMKNPFGRYVSDPILL